MRVPNSRCAHYFCTLFANGMNTRLGYIFILSLCTVATLLTGCFKKYDAKINIDGSSTVYPVTEAVAEEFREKFPFVRVTVGVSGTGGGFKKFQRGETDISNASRPIQKGEMEKCAAAGIEFIELPVAYDGIAVVVSEKNNFVDYLTIAELHLIWSPESQGKITHWNQVRAEWPAVKLNLYGAGTSSGTYDYFTEAVNGKARASRGDYTASEDDNVLVQGVYSDPGGLGYFGFAYYEENSSKLKIVPVKVSDTSAAITPSAETISNGTYQPLSRPEFIYVNAKSADEKAVQDFVQFYMQNAEWLVKDVGYVPLPAKAYELAEKRFFAKKTGSIFSGGKVVGADIVKMLLEN